MEILYRAADSTGQTVDFLLTANRDKNAAKRFLAKAISGFGQLNKINIDKNSANFAALIGHNDDTESKIGIRQIKYLNNIVEQDHRAIKRIIRSMMGCKFFWYAANTIAGIELFHMLRKRQMKEDTMLSLHQKFELLAA